MRRNAVSAGLITLLLCIASVASIGPSVAKDGRPATAHTAARTMSVSVARAVRVASSLKRRRVTLAAAVVSPSIPAPSPYVAAVDHAGVSDAHKKIATAVLNALPACRERLQNFSVLYVGATRRGLGGKTTIILDGSVPDDEFAALLVHECGHVIGANMQGSASSGDSGYRDGNDAFYKDSPMVAYWGIDWAASGAKKPGAKDADFASGYGKSDQYEDFAEAFALYVLQRDAFATRAKGNAAMAAKLAWFESNVPLATNALGSGTASGAGAVPWDVTKLAFTLSY